ncbi:JAB domain-containing protein [Bradyrhizobium cenepequi]
MSATSINGFSEAGITTLADSDLLSLFSTVGAVVSKRFLVSRQCLTSWSLVLDYLKSQMAFRQTEQFRVLFLDKKNCLIADEAMGEGTIDHTPVYPREVARRALELNASSLILVHNHPSGDPAPSSADVKMTKQLEAGLKLLGIAVHDHIVIGKAGHASMRSLQLI